jgi:hypothetical protein
MSLLLKKSVESLLARKKKLTTSRDRDRERARKADAAILEIDNELTALHAGLAEHFKPARTIEDALREPPAPPPNAPKK